ncbi:MAG: hypothetical protein AAGC46_02715 [Solirubrobacteraceae bacterium]|nr:hypothetical protein [Patulibacter sp.]
MTRPDLTLAQIDRVQQAVHTVDLPNQRAPVLPSMVVFVFGLSLGFCLLLTDGSDAAQTLGLLLIVATPVLYLSLATGEFLRRIAATGVTSAQRRRPRGGQPDASTRYAPLPTGVLIALGIVTDHWWFGLLAGAAFVACTIALYRPWLRTFEGPPRSAKQGAAGRWSEGLSTPTPLLVAAALAVVDLVRLDALATVAELDAALVDEALASLTAAGLVQMRPGRRRVPPTVRLTRQGRADFLQHVIALEAARGG